MSVTPSLIRDDSEQAIKQAAGLSDTLTPNTVWHALPGRGAALLVWESRRTIKMSPRHSSR